MRCIRVENTKDRSCFIMGLPGAGKTTYLAALSALLQEEGIEKKLRWPRYCEDSSYLTQLALTWFKGKEVLRTPIDGEMKKLPLHLEDTDGNQYRIYVPDISGESFQNLYKLRMAEPETVELFQNCDGILLFIHPGRIIAPTLISEMPCSLRLGGAMSADETPSAIPLTELLQFAEEIRASRPVSLGVVVSAWDVLPAWDKKAGPEAYIRTKIPLLWQYLSSNPEIFLTSYYGVSAQGGDLSDEKKANELLTQYTEEPIKRMKAIKPDGQDTYDLSLILWETLMG